MGWLSLLLTWADYDIYVYIYDITRIYKQNVSVDTI